MKWTSTASKSLYFVVLAIALMPLKVTDAYASSEDIPPADYARIHSSDIVELGPTYSLPSMPALLTGLRVLVTTEISGAQESPFSQSEQIQGCAQLSAAAIKRFGWDPTLSPTDPHDIVARASCSTSAHEITYRGSLYILLPLSKRSMRIESPTGELLVQLPEAPLTFHCPTLNAQTCGGMIQQYFLARKIQELSTSQALLDYVRSRQSRKTN